MSKLYKRECPCCGETFETNRIDKFYIADLHQRNHNNSRQYDKRKKLDLINKPLNATYNIYKELLGNKLSTRISKEFLKGRGANLKYFSHVEKIDGLPTHVLFDIAIINEETIINLRKIN